MWEIKKNSPDEFAQRNDLSDVLLQKHAWQKETDLLFTLRFH